MAGLARLAMCHRSSKKRDFHPIRSAPAPADAKTLIRDVLAPNLRAVFCGTALGHESFRQRAYYAHPGNQFWAVLHRIGLTPRKLKPAEYEEVLSFGIGLTDLCKIAYGNDHEIAPHHFDRKALEKKIRRYKPAVIAFTSKTSASIFLEKPTGKIPYGLQEEKIGETRIYVLPSPSGRARSWWKEETWTDLQKIIPSILPRNP
jgi:TDG/mug DNA glycosylase family protein